ncbi:HlyD family efflux transporter periplasmic adaptor subunit [Flavobacterium sp.]|uniref:HlyD family efflux transporter periplasmic adaptor subunit n=1 Tax=Flavobacterium sp. TaxID=239 RepID=UPI00286E830E|nr:HlyD family efflux transporter periplasmic adaptor subunit [Flavobacterium sp.]
MNSKIKYSEEFADTVNKFPRFNSILLYSLLAIIIVSFTLLAIIKSPEIIMGEAQVTALKPPIELIAQNSGKIILKEFASHKMMKKDDFLAVIENPANEEDVKKLKTILKQFQSNILELKTKDLSFAIGSQLGEIQEYYLNLINVLHTCEDAKEHPENDAKKMLLSKQIGKYNEMLQQRDDIKKIKKSDILLVKNKLTEDSILFSKGLILKGEYEQTIRNYYRENENLKSYESKDIENKFSISDNKQNISILNLEKDENITHSEMKLITSFQQLFQAINSWESKYVFKVPQDGEVDMMQFITSYQFIKQGDPIFSVLPKDNQVVAQLVVPLNGAGKIKIGQEVIIKLVSYPYQEFGKLVGKVKSTSLIPTENYYLITVDLPNGLKSDSNQELLFSKNMIGTAEIITEKRSLLSKMFNKIIAAFDKKPIEKEKQEKIVKI